ncbi:MAG: hypothetical protein Q7J54_00060, partial [Candidatus Woesearchaeota archaeon]|nr:hypothetical protein [Candidatus Woesearchaeota archaeon]
RGRLQIGDLSSTLGLPTYPGDIILDKDPGGSNGIGGIEFRSSVSAGGAGWKITATGNYLGHKLLFAPRSAGATWETEVLTLTQNGNVGIGTTSPGVKLEVSGPGVTGSPWLSESIRWYASSHPSIYGSLWVDMSGTQSGIAIGSMGTKNIFMMSDGNVGIGTTSPSTLLTVKQSATDTSFTGTSDTGIRIRLASDANGLAVLGFARADTEDMARIAAERTSSGSYLRFGTSNAYTSGVTNTAMTIDYNGNVGIGTTSPAYKLDVNGPARILGSLYMDNNYVVGVNQLIFTSPTVNEWRLATYNDDKLYIVREASKFVTVDTSGNVGIGTTTPGEKLEVAGNVKITGLVGSGNAYACVDNSGKLYRSASACS